MRTIVSNVLLFVCVISLLSHFGSARTKTKPFFLVNDDDYDNEVIDDLAMRNDQEFMNLKKEQKDDDVLTVDNGREISNQQEVRCEPRPVPVRIPEANQFSIYPSHVMLNRCLGPGPTSFQKCTVKKREKVTVKYNKNTFGRIMEQDSTVMYNDLQCTIACVAKEQDCDSRTQTFKNCHCNCNLNRTYCESYGRNFDPSTCQCICKLTRVCPLYLEWNPTTCQCECAQCIKEMCKNANLALDDKMCKCVS